MEIIAVFYGLMIFIGFSLWRTTGAKLEISFEKALMFGANKSEAYYEEEEETDHYFQIAFVCLILTLSWTEKND